MEDRFLSDLVEAEAASPHESGAVPLPVRLLATGAWELEHKVDVTRCLLQHLGVLLDLLEFAHHFIQRESFGRIAV